MKTKLILLTIFTLLLNMCGTMNAQIKKGTVSISAGTGLSILVPLVPKLLEAGANTSTITSGSIKAYTPPAFNCALDYSLGKVVSIGAGFTYQKNKAHYTGHTFYTGTHKRTEDFDFSISRANFGLRTLFHYSKKKNLDLYQGFRLGYSIWKVDLDTNDPNYTITNKKADSPSYQIILLGLKYYFDENLGIGAEFGAGSPYFASVSISGRF